MTRRTTIIIIATAAHFAFWALGSLASAQQGEAFVPQVDPSASQSPSPPPPRTDETSTARTVWQTDAERLARQLSLRLQEVPVNGTSNVLGVVQTGAQNRTFAHIAGMGNAVDQNQRGRNLESRVDIVGVANRVLVDQEGSNLDSDIGLLGAARKTVIHLQRGNANAPENARIDLQGVLPERLLVIETPAGRLTRDLP